MPKVLFLLRHAQSAEKQAGQADIDRELTAVGRQQAMQIGKFLFDGKKNPEIILCSTANRAKSTAMLVASEMHKHENEIQYLDELYELSVDDFHQIIYSLDNALSSLMIIGHNPILSFLVGYLTSQNFHGMNPAGLSIITFNTNQWSGVVQGAGALDSYVEPTPFNTN